MREKDRKKKRGNTKGIKVFLITLSAVMILGGVVIAVLFFAKKGAADPGEEKYSSQPSGVNEGDTASPVTGAVVDLPGLADRNTVSGTDSLSDNEAEEEPSSPYAEELAEAVVLGEEISPVNRYLVNTASEDEITFAFAGDILFDPRYAVYNSYKQRGSSVENCFSANLLEHMRRADVCMVNNEFPYSDGGSPLNDKAYTFRADPSSVSLLHDMGVDIAGIANNHGFDYGEEAFLDTLDTLAGAGIPYAGGGHNLEEASRPIYLYGADMKIAIITATQIERYNPPQSRGATADSPGMFRSWPNIDPVLEALSKAREECDYVILFIHWGSENKVEDDWAQQEQLPKFVEAGADMIIGAHPHILQRIDYYEDVPVVYSMGNFWFNSKTLDSCLIEADFAEGGLKELRFVPCRQSGCAVKMLEGTEAENLIAYMREISPAVNIDEDGIVTKK